MTSEDAFSARNALPTEFRGWRVPPLFRSLQHSSLTSRSRSTQASDSAASMLPLFAGQSDMIRANQKDDFYLEHLRNAVWNVAERIPVFGPSAVTRWRSEFSLMADFLYFGLTTGLAQKTLGEEYCDLMQVQGSNCQSVGWYSRWLLVALQVFPYYLLRKMIDGIWRYILILVIPTVLTSRLGMLFSCVVLRVARRRRLSRLYNALVAAHDEFIPSTSNGIASLLAFCPDFHRLHLALFFLFGNFLHFAKRLTGVRYVFLSSANRPQTSNVLLAVLLLSQVGITSWKVLRSFFQLLLLRLRSRSHQHQPETIRSDSKTNNESVWSRSATDASESSNATSESASDRLEERRVYDETFVGIEIPKCLFCLSSCECPTSTPCGHLFCWTCITQWCVSNPSCPLCRAVCLPQQLLPVLHYASSKGLREEMECFERH